MKGTFQGPSLASDNTEGTAAGKAVKSIKCQIKSVAKIVSREEGKV